MLNRSVYKSGRLLAYSGRHGSCIHKNYKMLLVLLSYQITAATADAIAASAYSIEI
jgi:hypothetical protein